ncbi:MAG: EF-hand domain-containing protein [Pseudomonadota bacterium]
MRLLTLILAALIATPAAAQQVPIAPPSAPGAPQPTANLIAEPVALMIAAFDADGDARVTRAEFDAGLKHAFESADPQHGGSVGYLRFSDWAERWLGNRNALPSPFEVDRDGDNRITFDELATRFDLLFTRFDIDKDRVLTRAELVMLRPQMLLRGRGGRGEGGELRRPGQ